MLQANAYSGATTVVNIAVLVQGGDHPRHAAYLGREVSTDFAMRGDSQALNFMYDTVMLLKPAVLSFDRLFRGVAHDPNKGAIAAKAGSLALFSMGLYLLNRDNPKYQDLKDWDKDANWHFFVGDQHFRYPKIWEIGAMASIAERTLASTLDENPDGLGKGVGRILGHTFNLNYMPQILAPIYEQATNENSFTRARIETPGMENLQPFLRAKSSTSETMKEVGMASRDLPEKLQVNPVRAEALLRGYFNTARLVELEGTVTALTNEKHERNLIAELRNSGKLPSADDLTLSGVLVKLHESGQINRFTADTKAEAAKAIPIITTAAPGLTRPPTSAGGSPRARSTPGAPARKSLVG